jgi:hypothetical protein
MPQIPAPELVGDTLTASLYALDAGVALVLGTPPPLPPEALLRRPGPLTIRYALPYLQREAAIVPGLFASEYGAMLVGREAWDYAMNHYVLHPRADILGLRSDGQQDQVMLRDLDFGREVVVLAYDSPDARVPLAQLAAYWTGPDAPPLPDLLVEHLPRLSAPASPNG